jgi:aerobic C4-dicarboxylate transport protein
MSAVRRMMSGKSLLGSLYVQVLCAVVIGALLGHLLPSVGIALKPLGDAFVKLIKMLIAPIIFCTVALGIAGMEDTKKVGRTGVLALIYFEIVSTVALLIGLVIVNLLQPGQGMNIDAASLDAAAVAEYATAHTGQTATQFLLDIIPATAFEAFSTGNILQILLFSILFGFALRSTGGRERLLFDLLERCAAVLFRIVGFVMRLAPLGACGAMAFTIGRYGVGSLASLGKLLACVYVACLFFICIVLGAIARLHGFGIGRFIRYIKEELWIVLGTSSSESVMPRMLVRLEELGVHRSVVALVLPTGYSFNLDGTSIYLTMAAVFIAQATNTPLDLLQQLTLLATLMLASKGAAGVTGSGFIVLSATLATVGHVPVAGVALLLGVDRFMSEARALTNLIGNGVATIVIGKWCGQLDESRLRARLAESRLPAVQSTVNEQL